MRVNNRGNLFIINMIAAGLSMVIGYGISFFFTPYLVRAAGAEAYGYVGLANNMVNYASVITIALNSVAGRFITIKIHSGDKEQANRYFNATIWSNVVIAAVLLVVFIPIVLFIDKIISIPGPLISSVKLLFAFVVINFLITIVSSAFSVATFITNQLFLTNIGTFFASLLRVVLLILLFGFFPTNVAYISFTAVICTLFLSVYNFVLTKKLTPELKIDQALFQLSKVKELVLAGIWNSVTKLSQILSDGLDLLISNLWISSYAMGLLSIAYMIPTICGSVISVIASLFTPQQTYYYAKGDIDNTVRQFKINMKLGGFFVSIIFVGIVVFGKEFFQLWVPSENTEMIYRLALLAVISLSVSGVTSGLNSVFLLTNHLKENSVFWLIISTFDIIAVLFLVHFTSLGVYAVAGVSKVMGLLGNLFFLPIYAAKCLGISRRTFYPIIIRYFLEISLLFGAFMLLKIILLPSDNWIHFIINISICAVLGGMINLIAFLNNDERRILFQQTVGRITKRKDMREYGQ